MASSINSAQVQLDKCKLQISVTTNAEKASADSVADFGNQNKLASDEVSISTANVETTTTAEQAVKSTLASLTDELGRINSEVAGISRDITNAKKDGKDGEDVASLLQQLEAKKDEFNQKKDALNAEITKTKNDCDIKTKDKITAQNTFDRATLIQSEMQKHLEQAQATNQTDNVNLNAAKVDLADAEKALAQAQSEQKASEELTKACNGNETLAAKLQGSYNAEAGASLAKTAKETHKDGVFDNACALGVRQSLEAEGILEKDSIKGHASDLIRKYGESGKFDVVKLKPGEEQDLPEGSILAIKKKEDGKDGSIDEYGHIAIIGYKRDENTGEILKDENGNPIREEISDHVGKMRDRSDRECYVIIPRNGSVEDAAGNGSATGSVDGNGSSAGNGVVTGHYIPESMGDTIENSNLDDVTKGKILGKVAGHQPLTTTEIEALKNAGIDTSSMTSSSASSSDKGVETEKGTGRYMDGKLKEGIKRSNLDEATKARLLALPEDSELSEADNKLLNSTNLSSQRAGTKEVLAFSLGNTDWEHLLRVRLKNAKTDEERQQIIDKHDGNMKYNLLSDEHLAYLKSFERPGEAEKIKVVVDNFPEVVSKHTPEAQHSSVSTFDFLDPDIHKNYINQPKVNHDRDRIITIDELKNDDIYQTYVKGKRLDYKGERQQMIKFLEENGKTSINLDKLRQMIIDAHGAGDGRHVNFMDCLS